MICYVDLEHPGRGPSMLTERPDATQRKADLVTIAARFERLAGVPCLLEHFSRVSHEVLRGLGVPTVVLSGTISISGIPSPRPGPKPPRAALDTRYASVLSMPRPERRGPSIPQGRPDSGECNVASDERFPWSFRPGARDG